VFEELIVLNQRKGEKELGVISIFETEFGVVTSRTGLRRTDAIAPIIAQFCVQPLKELPSSQRRSSIPCDQETYCINWEDLIRLFAAAQLASLSSAFNFQSFIPESLLLPSVEHSFGTFVF
jgi:hypothetical protein